MVFRGRTVNRRDFTKNIAASAAAMMLVLPGTTFAFTPTSTIEYQDGLHFIITNLFPKIRQGYRIDVDAKSGTAKVYKNEDEFNKGRYIQINGMALMVLELCYGHLRYSDIIRNISFFYEVNPYEIEEGVFKYMMFLYEEGYIVFGSANILAGEECKRGYGADFVGKNDKKIRLLSRSGVPSTVEF